MLPFDGPLVRDLAGAGVETLIGPVAVVRRELLSPRGLGRLARAAAGQRRALERLCRERGVALVHANTSAIVPAGLPRGVPRVVHVREIYAGWGPLWPPYRRALERLDARVCVSASVRAQFEAADVVHDGLALTPERAPRAAARAALGLPQDAFVVAVLGRVSAWKGQDVLARALAEPALHGAIGLVAGEPWPGQEQRAAPLRDAPGIRLLGFRDDVGTVLGAAD
ncbi:MAG TPA: glycosyltransferase, partial [Solirubrobacteraceae bacterium]